MIPRLPTAREIITPFADIHNPGIEFIADATHVSRAFLPSSHGLPSNPFSGFWQQAFPQPTEMVFAAESLHPVTAFNLHALEEMGLPPEIVGALGVYLTFGKIPTLLIVFGSLSFYFRSANRPLAELSEHIETVNRELPDLLDKLAPVPENAIRNAEEAKICVDQVIKLGFYADPHPLEKSGRARRGWKPFLARHALTQPINELSSWPFRKIGDWLEKKDHKLGNNPRIDNLTDLKEIQKRIRDLTATLTSYPHWKWELWQRFLDWKRRNISAATSDIPDPKNLTDRIGTTIFLLKQALGDLKHKIIRDGVIVMRGKRHVADYALPEYTPEAILKRSEVIGTRIETRLAFLKTQLDDPAFTSTLTDANRDDLQRELLQYEILSLYMIYGTVESRAGLLIDVLMRGDMLFPKKSSVQAT